MIKEVCDLLNIVKTRTTSYCPSANGQVERMNRTILQILRCFIRGQKEDWDHHMATVCVAIRSIVNRQNGFTPNFLMLWREVLYPIDLMLHPGGEADEELLQHMQCAIIKHWELLIERPGINSMDCDTGDFISIVSY